MHLHSLGRSRTRWRPEAGSGQTWTINVATNTVGHFWARTNCTFDSIGSGTCQTGNCTSGDLQCTGGGYGAPPNTLTEYALNQFNNLDLFDISLVNGFNVPLEFSPTSNNCSSRAARCTGNINGDCPNELRAPGGCNNPCTVFKTNEYCCFDGSACLPTNYTRFFRDRCPDGYLNPSSGGDQTTTFTCPPGTNYRVVFCP